MKISYNWLKKYINIDVPAEDLEYILTSTGLEVSSVVAVDSIKGGLEGVFIGEVMTCEKHADADKLSVCTVDVGGDEILPIVCGAPNVATGQKVAVAVVGCTLYPDGAEEGFKIKKAKIRGEVSKGMICAEDELGLGTSHDGIMVLDKDAKVGTPAADYFKIENDYEIEIDLTPNRSDAVSHIGVARDIAAYVSLHQNKDITVNYPSVEEFQVDNNNLDITINIDDADLCPRYTGLCLDNIKVGSSPEWMQNSLNAAGIRPINNIVDITNYVLLEIGHPLHAFDYDKVGGKTVNIKCLPEGTKFLTLDEDERKLSSEDLMICDADKGMCIAGVFGGHNSGVTEETTRIFLESAYFNPVSVRKTSKRHQLKTDASFRFERGADPEVTVYAIKRAAMLMKEYAGATISSEVIDQYPKEIKRVELRLRYARVNLLAGKEITEDVVKKILTKLEYVIKEESDIDLLIEVPAYRADVTREIDLIEEVMRVYSLNNIDIPQAINVSFPIHAKPDLHKVKNNISEFLSGNGFYEAWSNSISNDAYAEYTDAVNPAENVKLLNPLSSELNSMRQELIFGMLEALEYNKNRQNPDIKLYEFGSIYKLDPEVSTQDAVTKRFSEPSRLSILMSGKTAKESWLAEQKDVNFYDIKAVLLNVLNKLGIQQNGLHLKPELNSIFIEGMSWDLNGKWFAHCGRINPKLRKKFDIDAEVFYAEINWDVVSKRIAKHKTVFEQLPKYPEVRRDLALVVDKSVDYATIEKIALKSEKKLLKAVNLFDVFEDKKLGENKKSYAVSFILRDDEKTLNDKQIDKIMEKMIKSITTETGAILR